jgi:hypothetical protein
VREKGAHRENAIESGHVVSCGTVAFPVNDELHRPALFPLDFWRGNLLDSTLMVPCGVDLPRANQPLSQLLLSLPL